MSIPNYLVALANHKGPATVNAGGMTIPVKISNINHRSEYGLSDLCTFECLVVNEDQIRFSGPTPDETDISHRVQAAKCALNSVYGTRTAAYKPRKAVNPFEIKKAYFNDPVTVVIWADGTKTVVKCQEGDVYSKETGLALCIAKKALGNKGSFNDVFHKWIPEEDKEFVYPTYDAAIAKIRDIAAKAGLTFEVEDV